MYKRQLIVGLAYAVLNLNENLKKEQQRAVLGVVSKYVAINILQSLEELDEGQTIDKVLRLPLQRESRVTPYSVSLVEKNGQIFVRAVSTEWNMDSKYPLYLNSSKVVVNSIPSFPPRFCLTMSRDENYYYINITC